MVLQIGAILFGVGDGITEIKMNKGCSIIRGSIYDKDILNFFDEIPLNMQKKYTDAINHNDGTFYWIKAEYSINNKEYINDETELEYLTRIDKQVRMLRLSLKRYMYVKDFRYIVNISDSHRVCGNFPSPDLATEETINTDIVVNNIDEIEKLLKVDIPFKNKWIYNIFLVYEKSFSKDIEVSFVTIVTALEMIFLDNNKCIKEKMSKRIAVYLSDNYDERKEIYEKVRTLYEKRCNFVHEGKNNLITVDEIIYMRNIVSRIIIQFMESEKTKKDFYTELIKKVESARCWEK